MSQKVVSKPGDKHGRLTIIKRTSEKGARVRWLCMCDCGNMHEVDDYELRRKDRTGVKSCGCWRNELRATYNYKHGMSKSTEFRVWEGMMQRCDNPKHDHYDRYGGRGISYDPSWSDFEQFFVDMGPRPPGTYLDRIDNDKNYCKDNCTWSTAKEQANNRCNNKYLTLDGETLTVAEWADKLGVKYVTLLARTYKGWSDEKVLKTPIRKWTKT